MSAHVGHVVGIRLVHPWTTQHLDGLLLETVPPRPHPLPRRVDDHDVVKLGRPLAQPPGHDGQCLGASPDDHGLDGPRRSRHPIGLYAHDMARVTVTPALLDDLVARCRSIVDCCNDATRAALGTVTDDLIAVRDHLLALEHRDLGEWIRDLPPEQLGDFLADMEVTARQADADSDIGSFISAIADWQTTAEANRNGWQSD